MPVAQGLAGAVTVIVTYKEFGVRLTFTPQVAGDIIRLRVRPEVSALDFANGITLEGFRDVIATAAARVASAGA